MYLDPNKEIVHDSRPYTSTDGIKYPANYPKGEIAELVRVTTTAAPEGRVVDGYVVDSNNTQVWQSREKTEAEATEEALNAVYENRREAYGSVESQLGMFYHDLVDGTTTLKDHIAKVRTKYPKPPTGGEGGR